MGWTSSFPEITKLLRADPFDMNCSLFTTYRIMCKRESAQYFQISDYPCI